MASEIGWHDSRGIPPRPRERVHGGTRGGKVKEREQKEGDSRWASRLPKLQHGWPRPRAASVTAFNDLCNNESRLSKIFATMR